jgi:hypothetical protein
MTTAEQRDWFVDGYIFSCVAQERGDLANGDQSRCTPAAQRLIAHSRPNEPSPIWSLTSFEYRRTILLQVPSGMQRR